VQQRAGWLSTPSVPSMLTPPAAVGRDGGFLASGSAAAAAASRAASASAAAATAALGVEDLGRDRRGRDVAEADRGQQVVDAAELGEQGDVVLEARAVDAEAPQLALERLAALHDRGLAALQAKPLADLLARARGDDVAELRVQPVALGCWVLWVKISTRSPVASLWSSGTIWPLTSAPRQRCPTLVCTRYAKSTGVAPSGRSITSPPGVNT
jgi:hypothetical protein